MKIVIITQDEPFYLYDNLEYLFKIIPEECKIVGYVVNEVSPFGKKETFINKAIKTIRIFGSIFFYIIHSNTCSQKSKIKKVSRLLKLSDIPEISLNESINSKASLDKIKSYEPELLISILGNQIFKNLTPIGSERMHQSSYRSTTKIQRIDADFLGLKKL